jgi:hypothetical protein
MLNIAETTYIASGIHHLGRDLQDEFVSYAIIRLSVLDLSVPGHTRLFHPAVLLYWVLAPRFE